MRVKSVTYAITRQVKQYEPVRVEFTVEATSDTDTPQDMLEAARTFAENAASEAMSRGPVF